MNWAKAWKAAALKYRASRNRTQKWLDETHVKACDARAEAKALRREAARANEAENHLLRLLKRGSVALGKGPGEAHDEACVRVASDLDAARARVAELEGALRGLLEDGNVNSTGTLPERLERARAALAGGAK